MCIKKLHIFFLCVITAGFYFDSIGQKSTGLFAKIGVSETQEQVTTLSAAEGQSLFTPFPEVSLGSHITINNKWRHSISYGFRYMQFQTTPRLKAYDFNDWGSTWRSVHSGIYNLGLVINSKYKGLTFEPSLGFALDVYPGNSVQLDSFTAYGGSESFVFDSDTLFMRYEELLISTVGYRFLLGFTINKELIDSIILGLSINSSIGLNRIHIAKGNFDPWGNAYDVISKGSSLGFGCTLRYILSNGSK